MNYLELKCRKDRCWIDQTTEMDLKKCITQNSSEHPDRFDPCAYMTVSSSDEYRKGEVWKKFGDLIDKSKPKGKEKLE
jgi:hypothetical protein